MSKLDAIERKLYNIQREISYLSAGNNVENEQLNRIIYDINSLHKQIDILRGNTTLISQYNKNIPQYNKNIPQYNKNIPQYNKNIPQYNKNIPEYNKNIPE